MPSSLFNQQLRAAGNYISIVVWMPYALPLLRPTRRFATLDGRPNGLSMGEPLLPWITMHGHHIHARPSHICFQALALPTAGIPCPPFPPCAYPHPQLASYAISSPLCHHPPTASRSKFCRGKKPLRARNFSAGFESLPAGSTATIRGTPAQTSWQPHEDKVGVMLNDNVAPTIYGCSPSQL